MDTNNNVTSIVVDSRRTGKRYKINIFTEYRVDMDLDTDTDGFDFIFQNPDGKYTGIMGKFDKVYIYINNKLITQGDIDSVVTQWDGGGSSIHISGRDSAHILVDNDALPGTKQGVDPVSYARDICNQYGLKFHVSWNSLPAVDKLTIGCGESEISIINNLLLSTEHHLWFIIDTLYMCDYAVQRDPTYYFTRGVTGKQQGVPMESLSVTDDGTSTKSEIKIYGSMNDGKDKVVGTATNDYMVNNGIKRRKVKWSSNNDTTAKYSSSALKDVHDSFRDNIVTEIKIKTRSDMTVYPNYTARVIDNISKIDAVLYIKSVSYSKSIEGSFTTIKMIPGDTTFNVLWSGQGTKANGGMTGVATS